MHSVNVQKEVLNFFWIRYPKKFNNTKRTRNTYEQRRMKKIGADESDPVSERHGGEHAAQS